MTAPTDRFCHTPVTACEYPLLDSPEVPMTVPEPSMIRGPLIAEISSSRSPLRRFRDERFPWGPARSATALPGGSPARQHSRGWRTAPECPWSSRLMAVGQPGRAGRPGAMEGEGAMTSAGEKAGASRQLAPAGGGAAACAADDVVAARDSSLLLVLQWSRHSRRCSGSPQPKQAGTRSVRKA